jgi:hypothetical protein
MTGPALFAMSPPPLVRAPTLRDPFQPATPTRGVIQIARRLPSRPGSFYPALALTTRCLIMDPLRFTLVPPGLFMAY